MDLNPGEVAVIEVAGDWPKTVEEDWDTFEALLRNLVNTGAVRPRLLVFCAAQRCGGVLGVWLRLLRGG